MDQTKLLKVLKLEYTSDIRVVYKAAKRYAREVHPDQNPDKKPQWLEFEIAYNVIKKLSDEDTTAWSNHVNTALLFVNLKINAITNISPFQLFFNRDYAHPVKSILSKPHSWDDITNWIRILDNTSG